MRALGAHRTCQLRVLVGLVAGAAFSSCSVSEREFGTSESTGMGGSAALGSAQGGSDSAGTGAAASLGGAGGGGTAGTGEQAPALGQDGGTTLGGISMAVATGGTRLKPFGWVPAVADAGPPLIVGLTDTLLGFDCQWQVATDGSRHCLPEAYQGSIGYSDAACQSTVLVASASRCNPDAEIAAFGTLFNFNTCPASRSVWRRVAAFTGGMLYTRDATNACVPVAPLAADQKGWSIEPVELSSLVTATLKPDGSAPVVPVFIEADDGARQFFSWRSAINDVDCEVGLAADGETHCLPTPIATVGTFWVDSTCTQPAARTQRSSCTGDGQFVSNVANAVCPAATSIYRAGPKQTNAFQRDLTNTCSPATLNTSDIYPLGAELAPAAMDDAEIGMLPGTQRLRPLTGVTAGGVVTRPQYWDSQLNIVCTPTVGTNGRVYCMPRTTEPPRGYLESTCTGTQVFLRRTEDCDVSYGAMENTVCPVGKRIFELSNQPLTAGFWTTEAGGCTAVMPRGGIEAFAAGREVPPTEFVELERVTQ